MKILKKFIVMFAFILILASCQKNPKQDEKQTQEQKNVTKEIDEFEKDSKHIKKERKATHKEEIEKFKKENSDTVGILKVENTKIDYPVVQAKDNDFYMRKNFQKQYYIKGSIFMDYEDNLKEDPDNIVIYGHNMEDFNDREMFKDVTLFKDQKFFDKNKTITLYTDEGDRTYEVVGIYSIEVSKGDFFPYHEYINLSDDMNSEEYIDQLKEYAVHTRDLGIKPNDKLITLSTCTYEGENTRCVLVGKEI